jgi:hypothetical protein
MLTGQIPLPLFDPRLAEQVRMSASTRWVAYSYSRTPRMFLPASMSA